MRPLDNLAVSLVHECGARLQVPVERLSEPYHCTSCGQSDQIDAAKIPGIMADVGATLIEVNRRVQAGHQSIHTRFDRAARTFHEAEPAHV